MYERECPICGKHLTIEEDGNTYVIIYKGYSIDECPDCETPLRMENGELVEDER